MIDTFMQQRNYISWFILAMLLLAVAPLPLAAESAEVAAVSDSVETTFDEAPSDKAASDKAATMEMKQTLVRFAQERNELKAANELLQNQSWLLIFYSVVMSLLSGWLGLRMLAEPTPMKRQNGNTDSFSANTTNTIGRKNATITVRNGTTQQPEVVEHAQTRRLFNGNNTASEARPTVRIERRSDGLDQAGIARGTGAITRTKAFSLLEVMISVAVLATVLMAVMSSSYTLRQVQRSAKEQSQVEELTANLGERIMGANWDWIGRERPDETVNGTTISYKKGAWSWHRREQRWKSQSSARVLITPGPVNNPLREEPLSGQTTLAADDDLVKVGLLEEKTGIENLSVFVEYYRSSLLEAVFNATTGEAPSDKWRQYAPAGISDETEQVTDDKIYPQDENVMNLRNDAKAIIVRIVVTWKSTIGGERRHELVFARRK
jgi:type II secretory pathway pseudopilin PulG